MQVLNQYLLFCGKMGKKDKYNKTLLKSLKLAGEEFANNKALSNVEIKNLVPASRAYEKTLARDFVDAKSETAVRFQLRDNKSAKDIEKLQNTVTRLKEQFKLTKGVKLDEKAVRKFSKTILKDYMVASIHHQSLKANCIMFTWVW